MVSLLFQILLHMWLLLLVLYLLFTLLIIPQTQEYFRSKVTMLESEVRKATAVEPWSKGKIFLQPYLDPLIRQMEHPDPDQTRMNTTLKISFWIVWVLWGCVTVAVYFLNAAEISLIPILIETVFLFAGLIFLEYLFYTWVAKEFIPFPPSLFLTTVENAIQM